MRKPRINGEIVVDVQGTVAWLERRAEAAMLLDWSRSGIPAGYTYERWSSMSEIDRAIVRAEEYGERHPEQ